MKNQQSTVAIIAIILATLGLVWFTLPAPHEDSLSRYEQGSPVRVGYALEAPFTNLSPEGEVGGTEPALLRLALSRLGHHRIQWVHAEFENLIHELRSGRIDIVCAGMFITEERAAQVAFTRPTLRVPPGLLLREGASPAWSSLAGLAADDAARVAVLGGSTDESAARRAGLSPRRIRSYPDAASAVSALLGGEVDVLMLPSLSLQHLIRIEETHTLRHVILDGDEDALVGISAFAVRKEDRRLLDALNATLAGIVGTPEHAALLASHAVPGAFLPHLRTSPP